MMRQSMRSLFVSLLLATRLSAGDCQPELSDGLRYAIGGEALSLVAFDANGDAKLDIVAAAAGRTQLAVLHNNGTTFSNDTAIELGQTALELFVHGNEIVAAGPQHISVVSGANGVRTTTLTGTSLAKPIVLAQLTGDATPDIAAMTTDGNLRIFRGNADRTFTLAGSQSLPASPYREIAAAEVTGDAHGDVIVADIAGAYILPGNGDGTFGAKRDLVVTNGNARWAGTADLDGDSRADIVIGGQGIARQTLLSSRNYQTPVAHAIYASWGFDDLDGDGKLDAFGDGILYKGGGDGTFTATARSTISLNDGIFADFDGDGRKDVAGAAWIVDGVVILSNNGDGTFRGGRRYAIASTIARKIVTADLNRDGFDDVVVSSGAYTTIHLGTVTGELVEKERLFDTGQSTVAGDFTGDGIPDLFTTKHGVQTGNGDGTFIGDRDKPQHASDEDLVAADVNGDGKLDVVGANRQNQTISIRLGDGNRDFALTEVHAGGYPVTVRVADVNGDARPDVIAAGTEEDQQTYTLRLLVQRPDGTFEPSVIIHRDGSVFALAVADFDANGTADLVVTDGFTNTRNSALVVLRGHGNGTFSEWQRMPLLSFNPSFGTDAGITTGDFNADGRLDIAAVFGLGWANTFAQNAAGTFETASQLLYLGNFFSTAAGDVDNDGADDLVADGLHVFVSSCPAARTTRVELTMPSSSNGGVTMTADVAGATEGHVRFLEGDDGHTLGVAPVVNGRATLTLSELPKQRYFVHAVYSGHDALARSVSDVVTHDVIDISPKRRAVRH